MVHVIVVVYAYHPSLYSHIANLGYPIRRTNGSIMVKISINHYLKGIHPKQKYERIKREHTARQEYNTFFKRYIGSDIIETFAV